MQCLEPLDILCHCEFVKTPRELTFGHHCALLTLSLFFFQSSAVCEFVQTPREFGLLCAFLTLSRFSCLRCDAV